MKNITTQPSIAPCFPITGKSVRGPRFRKDGTPVAKVMVSFRADMEVINSMKQLAQKSGIPYQSLLRQVIKDFVDQRSDVTSVPNGEISADVKEDSRQTRVFP